MGCCTSTAKISPEEKLSESIKSAIESNSHVKLNTLCGVLQSLYPSSVPPIDRPILSTSEITLNPLSYCICHNHLKSFRYILLKMDANVAFMEGLLAKHQISALDILCQSKNTEMLKLYLPIYLENEHYIATSLEIAREPELQECTDTPVQKACKMGNIAVISAIFNYFETAGTPPPKNLDINYPQESTGENCALIACRAGNLAMMKFLFETCRADFEVKNKHGENAIAICLAGGRKRFNPDTYAPVMYLIETVGLNFTENYEEALLMADDDNTITYLENKLKQTEICVTKKQIEAMNAIKPQAIPKTDLEIDLEQLPDDEFCIKDYISDDTISFTSINTPGLHPRQESSIFHDLSNISYYPP